jgi:hypothetical protein
MMLCSIVLVVHVTAVLVLCAALSIELLSLFHLRRASTSAEALSWIDPVPRLPLFAVGSLPVILSSGVYLVIQESASGKAWPKVAASTLLLMAPLGAMTARRMRAIRKAYGAKSVISSELLGLLRDPFLKLSLGIRVAVFLGIFLLVSAKPGLWGSVALVGTSVILGLLSSVLGEGRSTALSSADFAD